MVNPVITIFENLYKWQLKNNVLLNRKKDENQYFIRKGLQQVAYSRSVKTKLYA